MRELVLGTAGHIDHGKTALVRALTGVDADRLPEEKRRGITIDLGFARLPLRDDLAFSVVDVPGHEDFVRNMMAGASGIDLVILVVAADEGIMPQTREHLTIVEALGVRSGVVALTKVDLVDAEWLELVRDELRETLADGPFHDAAIVPVSAVSGKGVEALRSALADAAARVPERRSEDLFRMPVDRVFTVRGTGTVVTGTVWSGRLRRDATVRVLPSRLVARVRALQAHGVDLDEVRAGQRSAVALAGVERSEIERGATLVDDPRWEPTRVMIARIQVAAGADGGIRQRQRVRFHLGTSEVMARVQLLDAETIGSGAAAWARIRLEERVVARAGDRFVLRSYSPVATIGGGTVIEPHARRYRRALGMPVGTWGSIAAGDPAAALEAMLETAGWEGVDEPRLAFTLPGDAGARGAAIRAVLDAGAHRLHGRLFGSEVVRDAQSRILGAVQQVHGEHPLEEGIERAALRRALPASAAPALADYAIDVCVADGLLEQQSGVVRERGHRARTSEEQERVLTEIAQIFDTAALASPRVEELPEALRARRDLPLLLRTLEQRDVLRSIAPGHYVSARALAAASETLHATLVAGRTPAELRDALGVTRKYLMPLLEYFDRVGITYREGDKRFLGPPRG